MTANARLFGLALVLAVSQAGCESEPLEMPPVDEAHSGSEVPGDTGQDRAALEYPAGPYGTREGATIPNLEYLGWRSPADAAYDPAKFETIRLSDFYNPDGTKGNTKLLLLNASAIWCSVCRSEMKHFRETDLYRQYKERGLEIVGILFEDNNYNPAKPEDLVAWGSPKNYDIHFPLVLDPGFKIGAFFISDATPLNLLVDATTMQIIDATMGYDTSEDSAYWRMVDGLLE
jgi:hypothetical protein